MQPKQLPGFTYTPQVYDPNKYFSLLSSQNQPTVAPQPQKKKGRGGILSSLISELSGAGGAATGAAIGSLAGPLGTVVGAGLGGFLGGTGGRIAENEFRDSRVGLGDALKEGGLAGALSLGGEAFQVAKGAKAARGLSSVLGDEAGAVSKAAPRIGMIENKGLGLTSKAGGYFVGATQPGAQPLTPSKVKFFDKLLRDLKIGGNDASDLARGVEGRLNSVSDLLNTSVATANRPIAKQEMSAFTKDLVNKVNSVGGLTSTGSKFADEQAARLGKVKSVADLLNFRKELDKSISFVANPQASTAERQAVARIFRTGIKDKVNSLVPGLKEQNNLYHNLSDLQGYVLRAANRTGAESTQGGGGFWGRVLSSPTANTLKAKTGRGLESVGQVTAGTGGFGSQVTRNLKLQSPGGLGRALSGQAQSPEDQQLMQAYEQYSGGQQPMGPGGTPDLSSALVEQPGQGAEQSPYSLSSALADIQRDPKNTATYLNLYKTVEAATKPDKTSIKAQDALATGSQALNIVDQLEQSFGKAGGGQGRLGGTLSSLRGKAGLNSNVSVYNDARTGFMSNVARALGEKGVLTDQDIERVGRLFPTPSATPQEAAAKWAQIRSIISGGINKFQSAYGAGNATPDLTSVLSSYGGM